MYNIFIDSPEQFTADIQIEGADSDSTKCRLVIDKGPMSILFEGNIKGGKVVIPIPSLKSILKEGDSGNIKLEVVADDVFFTPWESLYQAALSKKVTVEVADQSKSTPKKPLIEVSGIVETNPAINELSKYFIKHKISFENTQSKLKSIKKLSEGISKKYNIKEDKMLNIVVEAMKLASRT